MAQGGRLRRWVLVVLAAAAALALVVAAALHRADTGYLSPVFAPDGQSILVIAREVRATVAGLGFDSFTPPADVWIHYDRFALQRIHLATGRADVLVEFPPSPLEGRHVETYRGRIFTIPSAHLRWASPNRLAYEISVTEPRQPSSVTNVVRGEWDVQQQTAQPRPAWKPGASTMGGIEPSVLSGARELITLRGREGMACGVVVYEATGGRFSFAVGERACARDHDEGVTVAALEELSHRKDIERADMLKRTYDDLVRAGLDAGRSEGDAYLAAIREMQRLGHYPRPPQLTARRLTRQEATALTQAGGLQPLFEISETEFQVGLFPDIQAAVDQPGEPAEKSTGDYIRHRDFSTSVRLNSALNSGTRVFYVRRGPDLFQLTYERPR